MTEEIHLFAWTGSATFTSSLTPFGYFDTDPQFIAMAPKVADWCARRLGYPQMAVELDANKLFAAFEEATIMYSNIVSEFNTIDNIISLQGTPNTENLTGVPILPDNANINSISEQYGESANGLIVRTGSFVTVPNQQVYDLSASLVTELPGDLASGIEIRKVLHDTIPSMAKVSDPYLGSIDLVGSFGINGSIPAQPLFMMMPIHLDMLKANAIGMSTEMRRSAFGFELNGPRLRLFPIPHDTFTVHVHYTTKADRDAMRVSGSFSSPINLTYNENGSVSGLVSDASNVPFDIHSYSNINASGRNWILNYTLSIAKEMLGMVRSKHQSIPGLKQDMQLNGPELLSQAQTEKEQQEIKLREFLQQTTRQAQLERKSAESAALTQYLQGMPMGIYVM